MAARVEQFALGEVRTTEQGYLVAPAGLARIGVQYYRDPISGEITAENRPEKEVKDSVPYLQNIPLTIDHPPEFLTPENTQKYQVGSVINAEYRDGVIYGEVQITDARAIELAQTTHGQLSVGSLVEVRDKDGIFIDTLGVQGKQMSPYPHEKVQTNIRPNHVAMLPRGNAGEVASFRFDGCDDLGISTIPNIDSPTISVDNHVSPSMTLIFKEKTYAVEGDGAADLLAAANAAEQDRLEQVARVDSLTKDLEAAKEKVSSLEGQTTTLTAEVKRLDAETAQDKIDEEVQARMQAWAESGVTELERIDTALTATEVKAKTLQGVYGDNESIKARLDALDVDFIDGAWQTYLATRSDSKTEKNLKSIQRNDAEVEDEEYKEDSLEKLQDGDMNKRVNAYMGRYNKGGK